MSRYSSSVASVAVAVAIAAVTFGAEGGVPLGRTTVVEIALFFAAGALVAWAAVRSRGGRLDGGITALCFAALAAVCAASVVWSIVPAQSWLEANRTLAYLAVFAAAIAAARLWPDRHAVLLRGLLGAVSAIVVYALASHMWPGTLGRGDIAARLLEPYGDWNALGATAALSVPAVLWLGTRRAGRQAANVLAYPLLSLVTVTLFLTFSRAALIAAGVVALVWLVVVPLRVRTLVLLAVALAGSVPVVVWSLSKDAFTRNDTTVAVRDAVATPFGLLVLATAVVVLLVGVVAGFWVANETPSLRRRLVLAALGALVAAGAAVAMTLVLQSDDHGLGLTVPPSRVTAAGAPVNPLSARASTAPPSRGQTWHEAHLVFDAHALGGAGAGSFGVARLRYRKDLSESAHAQGYVAETMSGLGWVGLGISLALVVSWLLAASRAVALPSRRRRAFGFGPDRLALVAMALCVVAYAIVSAFSSVWFVPGTTVMAVVAAGFVVGRGPLRRATAPPLALAVAAWDEAEVGEARVAVPAGGPAAEPATALGGAASGRPSALHAVPPLGAPPDRPGSQRPDQRPPPSAPGGVGPPAADGASLDPSSEDTALLRPPLHRRLLRPRLRLPRLVRGDYSRALRRTLRGLLAAAAVAAALACAWSAWQQWRASDSVATALTLSARDDIDGALHAAGSARSENPLSPEPLFVRAHVNAASDSTPAAIRDLRRAVGEFRADPSTWLRLAQFELYNANNQPAALSAVAGALYLDPHSRAAQNVFFKAKAPPQRAPATPAPSVPSESSPIPPPNSGGE